MINVIILILVFLIESLFYGISTGIFIMPYLLYLSIFNSNKNIFFIVALSFVYSLQTFNFFINTVYFFIYYIVFLYVQKFIEYSYINILIFLPLEIILWFLLFRERVTYFHIVYFILCGFINFLLIKAYKNKISGTIR